MNGGTTPFQLEQRFRLPGLFDPPQVVDNANIRLNPGSDPEVTVKSEERCGGGRMGFNEVGSIPSDSQRILGARNGTVYGRGLNEHAMFENISRIGLRAGNALLRNDSGTNPVKALDCVPHTGANSEQAGLSISSKKPLFPGLNGPAPLDQSITMIPSTSTCDLGPKPLFSRLNFGDGSSRFSGSGPPHELFPKVANDISPQLGRFADGPPSLMSFGNAASSNQACQSIGPQIYDSSDKSTASFSMVQTNALNKLDSGGK